MRILARSFWTLLIFIIVLSIDVNGQLVKDNYYKKGNYFVYWGWNRDAFSKSNITFTGTDYDFELTDVIAKDRQSPFTIKGYFSPSRITIPQYNFRFGYFIHDNFQLSIGADHMKYVMQQDQTVVINGKIENSGTSYDGEYKNRNIVLADTFLKFEHTDGLNYENIELRRFDVLFGRKNFSIALNEGLGIGVLIPRTNTTLMKNERYDEFHISGYGIGTIISVNLTFFKYFFVQSEWKGGFIHMPDIRTTMYKEDRASQHFLFSQYNIVFGGNFRIPNKNKVKT